MPIRSRLAVNTADAAIAAILRGVGISRLLSYQVAEPLGAGKLKRLLIEHEPEPVPVSLLYARQGRLPAKTRAFLELAVARLTSALGQRG